MLNCDFNKKYLFGIQLCSSTICTNKHELGGVPMFKEYKLILMRVVEKNICKYILYLKIYVNSRQNVGNAIKKVKAKLSLALFGLQEIFILDLFHFTIKSKLYTYYSHKVFASLS